MSDVQSELVVYMFGRNAIQRLKQLVWVSSAGLMVFDGDRAVYAMNSSSIISEIWGTTKEKIVPRQEVEDDGAS
jgi:hypothetical protein